MAQLGTVEWFMEFYDIDRATAEKAHKAAQMYAQKVQDAPDNIGVSEPKILRQLAIKKDRMTESRP